MTFTNPNSHPRLPPCFPALPRSADSVALSPCHSVPVPAGVPPALPSPFAHGRLLQHASHLVFPQKPQGQRQQRVYSQAWRFGRGEGEDAGVSFKGGRQGRQGQGQGGGPQEESFGRPVRLLLYIQTKIVTLSFFSCLRVDAAPPCPALPCHALPCPCPCPARLCIRCLIFPSHCCN